MRFTLRIDATLPINHPPTAAAEAGSSQAPARKQGGEQ